jgi:hypothetical protein
MRWVQRTPWQRLNWLVHLDEILYCGNDIKGDLDHSKTAVCVYPLINLNRLVDFYEILFGCNAVQGDLHAVILIQ